MQLLRRGHELQLFPLFAVWCILPHRFLRSTTVRFTWRSATTTKLWIALRAEPLALSLTVDVQLICASPSVEVPHAGMASLYDELQEDKLAAKARGGS